MQDCIIIAMAGNVGPAPMMSDGMERNDAATAIGGYSIASLLGKAFADASGHPSLRQQMRAIIAVSIVLIARTNHDEKTKKDRC